MDYGLSGIKTNSFFLSSVSRQEAEKKVEEEQKEKHRESKKESEEEKEESGGGTQRGKWCSKKPASTLD